MDVLDYTPEDVKKIQKIHHVNDKTIKRDVNILKKWIKQQRHLPQKHDDEFLERCLLRNKFRIEQTKIKLEGYFTLRGLYKEYYQECNEDFTPSKEIVIGLPLPVLTPSLHRIICVKFSDPDPEVYDINRVVKFFALLFEILVRRDYSNGEVFIFDCRGATLEHMKKITVTELAKIYTLYQGAYSGRLISVDFLNAPSFLNVILGILKIVFPPKLYKKIRVHNDLESLQRTYPKRILPKDYGGDLESIDALRMNWDRVFAENLNLFDKNFFNVSEESLRTGDVAKSDVFGVEGSFKVLNLD